MHVQNVEYAEDAEDDKGCVLAFEYGPNAVT
jgi:hypothetical protein